jgi:hypothetical protein
MTPSWQIIGITPEPTEEERDAIIAALAVLAEKAEQQRATAMSRWREAAKLESLRRNHWHQGRTSRWNHGPGRAISASRSDFSPQVR